MSDLSFSALRKKLKEAEAEVKEKEQQRAKAADDLRGGDPCDQCTSRTAFEEARKALNKAQDRVTKLEAALKKATQQSQRRTTTSGTLTPKIERKKPRTNGETQGKKTDWKCGSDRQQGCGWKGRTKDKPQVCPWCGNTTITKA